jgi:hypothetical protein
MSAYYEQRRVGPASTERNAVSFFVEPRGRQPNLLEFSA